MLVQHFLEESARRVPEKVALVCGSECFRYADLDARADRLATALRARGLQPGDRVAIDLGNSATAVIAVFAVAKAGGVFVLLHPATKAGKLRAIVADAGARVLLTTRAWEHNASPGGNVQLVVHAAGGAAGDDRSVALETLLATPADCQPPPARAPRDLACLIYTSGSSGEQKGVMLSHKNMASASASIMQYLRISSADVVLDTLPLSFDYGLYNVLMPLRAGATVVLEPSFTSPHQLVGLVQRAAATVLPLVPAMIAILLQFASSIRIGMPTVRCITSTGQVLPPAHVAPLARMFPAAAIFSMYGLTECKRALYLPPEQLPVRPASVGIPIPGSSVTLVDAAGREVTEPDVVGELRVRGEHVMLGYWNRPRETACVLAAGASQDERVLRTGDLFYRDREGYFYFVARRDDVIKTAGGRVSPREVEAVIAALPEVCEVAAVRAAHPVLGEVVRAIVAPRPGAELTAAAVLAECAGRLEDYAVPRFVEFRRELPHTANGKIDYRALSAAGIAGVAPAANS